MIDAIAEQMKTGSKQVNQIIAHVLDMWTQKLKDVRLAINWYHHAIIVLTQMTMMRILHMWVILILRQIKRNMSDAQIADWANI